MVRDLRCRQGIPTALDDAGRHGHPWNTALQGHCGKLWPELEAQYVHFKDGPNDGRSQLALTAGLVVGRFELSHRARLIIGGGFQKVVSSFKTFERTWLLTARVAF